MYRHEYQEWLREMERVEARAKSPSLGQRLALNIATPLLVLGALALVLAVAFAVVR
jgi:hypothetical protein